MSQDYKVYLSSTLDDLRKERDAVKKVLQQYCIIKESYFASDDELAKSVRDDMQNCDIYIGILGARYGYVPEGSWNEEKRSITELEYESAKEKNVACLMFVKTISSIPGDMTDAYSGKDPKERIEAMERIEAFRNRVAKEQRPAEFSSAEELATSVLIAFWEFKSKRDLAQVLVGGSVTHARTLRTDIVIGCVPGTDDVYAKAIRDLNDKKRFDAVELSPDEDLYLAKVDRAVREARVGCLLITKASLTRLKDGGKSEERVAAALAMMAGRRPDESRKAAFVLLDGVARDEIPASWSANAAVSFFSGSVQNKESLDSFYGIVRRESGVIAPDIRVGLPYVIIALRKDEIARIIREPEAVFAGFESEEDRGLRKEQFTNRQTKLAHSYAGWPDNCYGLRPDDWKPLGPHHPTAQTLLQGVVDRINQTAAGSRERRMLRNANLHLQRYTFDEFRHDTFGSRQNLVEIRDSGCLVFVDEIALLHPEFRSHAAELLKGLRTAVVSISPFDPAQSALREVLGDASALRVGTLFDRFRDTQDPRCELALNSIHRVERWLRLVLPELVANADMPESQPDLVERTKQLLSS